MIILDTNVLSELMKTAPSAAVRSWILGRSLSDLATTAICQAEILSGISILPEGRRKQSLLTQAQRVFSDNFSEVYAFDSTAATCFGEVVAARRRSGLAPDLADMMIAAIALANGAAVATRNVADFAGCGIDVIDPWSVG